MLATFIRSRNGCGFKLICCNFKANCSKVTNALPRYFCTATFNETASTKDLEAIESKSTVVAALKSTLKKPLVCTYPMARTALLIYKEKHGHLLVQQSFTVPTQTDLWPSELWGLKLGSLVSRIRRGIAHNKHRTDLESIGFDYSSQSTAHSYALVKSVLLLYKEKNGHMLVPRLYIIPSNTDEWPVDIWGMRLGAVVKNIRTGHGYKDHREDFIKIGFDYTSQSSAHGFVVVKSALDIYKEKYGDMLVPFSFAVPYCESWPKELWGLKLGTVVNSIRGGTRYKDHREELTISGFDYSSQSATQRFDSVRAALLRYKEKHGNMLVHRSFIIPDKSKEWPEETWGIRLGKIVSRIRSGQSRKDQRDELMMLGFDYQPQVTVHGYPVVRAALLIYKSTVGNVNMPQAYVVPSHTVDWPEDMWGMRLGVVLKSIRNGRAYKDHYEELSIMGVKYNKKAVYDSVIPAVMQFKDMHGDDTT